MSTRFTTGEFAKLHHVSKQTLIYYDKIDLFKPQIQDTENGYRYYSVDQMELFNVIHLLKELGLPLKTIKSFMENRNVSRSIQLLEHQQSIISKKIKHLQKISAQITGQLTGLHETQSLLSIPNFSIQSCKAQKLYVHAVKAPGYALEVEISFKELLTAIAAEDLPVSRQIGVIIDFESLNNQDFLRTKSTFTKVRKPFKSSHIFERPEGLYAVAFHKGSYADIGYTYKKLIAFATTSHYQICGDSYELCVIDSFTASTPEDYQTQISIPVRPC